MAKNKSKRALQNEIIKDQFAGCMLGLAMGDAMGYEVKSLDFEQIQRAYGKKGLTKMIPNKTTKNMRISDETQLSLFTLHGIMWADYLGGKAGISNYSTYVFYSYQQWLYTQMEIVADVNYQWILDNDQNSYPCDFLSMKAFYKKRSPSRAIISTLESESKMNYGKLIYKINNNKASDCLRTAPAGLYFFDDPECAFRMGLDFAAITHTAPDAYLAAGCLSCIIANILNGFTIEQSALNTLKILKNYNHFEVCFKIIDDTLALLESDIKPMEAVKQLGDGRTAESALGIGLYCACCHSVNAENAILLAINQDGNSDACGSVCGAIVGAYAGAEKLPKKWRQLLQFSSLIEKKSRELYVARRKSMRG